MKYLYLILRLFFCPHKWVDMGNTRTAHWYGYRNEKNPYKTTALFQCVKCGKTKSMRIE